MSWRRSSLQLWMRPAHQSMTSRVAPIVAVDGGPPMRSVGNGSTTPYDITREEEVHNMVHVLSSSVCERMRRHKVVPKTVEARESRAPADWGTASQVREDMAE